MSSFDPNLSPVISGPLPHIADWRGSLTKLVVDGRFAVPGFEMAPRQILVSSTREAGVIRGLHAQKRPHSEAKILVALAGRMFWVVVDLRAESRSFRRWQGFTLAPAGTAGATDVVALQVPAGFAHGCLSLTADTSLLILADRDYTDDAGVGIAWNDDDLGIDWPLDGRRARLSEGHSAFGSFNDFCRDIGSL